MARIGVFVCHCGERVAVMPACRAGRADRGHRPDQCHLDQSPPTTWDKVPAPEAGKWHE